MKCLTTDSTPTGALPRERQLSRQDSLVREGRGKGCFVVPTLAMTREKLLERIHAMGSTHPVL